MGFNSGFKGLIFPLSEYLVEMVHTKTGNSQGNQRLFWILNHTVSTVLVLVFKCDFIVGYSNDVDKGEEKLYRILLINLFYYKT